MVRDPEIVFASIKEALGALGLLNQSAQSTLLLLIPECLSGAHPRAVATRFRKCETATLSSEGKSAMGVRRNAALSEAALAELSIAGLKEPLTAHEITLLRAVLTVMRSDVVAQAKACNAQGLKYRGWFYAECPGCSRLNGTIAAVDRVVSYPPNDCARRACGIGLTICFDRLHGLE